MYNIDYDVAESFVEQLHTKDELKQNVAKHLVTGLNFSDSYYEFDGIQSAVNAWMSQKLPIVEMFRKSKFWNEESLAIIKEVDFSFSASRRDRICLRDELFNSIMFYLKEKTDGHERHEEFQEIARILQLYIRDRFEYGEVGFYTERIEDSRTVSFIKEVLGFSRVQTGMKYSRLLQKLVASWVPGILTDASFMSAYSTWVDNISEKTVKYKFVVSLNPTDYLLMSYGNSWTSCHIVNPGLSRAGDSYSGMFRSGTLSYMLDKSTAISYLVKAETNNDVISYEPKVIRQVMFFNEENKGFFQSRMYPVSDNDNYYELFSTHVKILIEELFGSTGEDWYQQYDARIESAGSLHYKDYHHFSNVCKNNYQGNSGDLNYYTVGYDALCLKCGNSEIELSETLYCPDCGGGSRDDDDNNDVECEQCGSWVDGDNAYYIGDGCFCSDCVFTCGYCDDYGVYSNGVDTETHGRVCDYCYEENFCSCEECGGVYHNDEINIDPDANPLCPDCYCDKVGTCDTCSEEFFLEDLDDKMNCEECAEKIKEAKNDDKEDTDKEEEVIEVKKCAICEENVPVVDGGKLVNDHFVCDRCYDEYYLACESCGVRVAITGDFVMIGGHPHCTACSRRIIERHTCSSCGNDHESTGDIEADDSSNSEEITVSWSI